MLNFVKRWEDRRTAKNRKRGIVAFRSLVNTLPPLAYVRPLLRRVTAQSPYQGVYLEDDMTLALQPDGTPLETYTIDGYAIDNLWLGYDKAACRAYLDSLPEDSPHLLPVYSFTQEMATLATPVLNQTLRTNTYTYLVEFKDAFWPLTALQFRSFFLTKQPVPVSVGRQLRCAA